MNETNTMKSLTPRKASAATVRKMLDAKNLLKWSLMSLCKEKAVGDVTLQEIVKKSNKTIGSFYHHFKSKDEIVVEIGKEFSRILENIYFNMRDESKEIGEIWRDSIAKYLKLHLENAELALIFAYGVRESNSLRSYWSVRKADICQELSENFRKRRALKMLPDEDMWFEARLIVGGLEDTCADLVGGWSPDQFQHIRDEPEETVSFLLRTMFRLVLNQDLERSELDMLQAAVPYHSVRTEIPVWVV